MSWTYKPFENCENGLVREPVNVEQVTVKTESTRVWLCIRKNDLELKFDLKEDQARHLAGLLINGAELLSSPEKRLEEAKLKAELKAEQQCNPRVFGK
jgi:RNase P/RNase MRP subunit p29